MIRYTLSLFVFVALTYNSALAGSIQDVLATAETVQFQRWFAGLHEEILDDESVPEGSPQVAMAYKEFKQMNTYLQIVFINYFEYWQSNVDASALEILKNVHAKARPWRTFFLFTKDHEGVDMVAVGITAARGTLVNLFAKTDIGHGVLANGRRAKQIIKAKGQPSAVSLKGGHRGIAQFELLLNTSVTERFDYTFKKNIFDYHPSESHFLGFRRTEYDSYQMMKIRTSLGLRQAFSIFDEPTKYSLQITELIDEANTQNFDDIRKYLEKMSFAYSCSRALTR